MISKIEGGFKRDLGNGTSLYLYKRFFNTLVGIGKTNDPTGYDDGY